MPYFLYVDGICTRNGKILLVKRNCDPFKGFWHVVGGEVKEDEPLENALKREFIEETGLKVKIGNMLGWRTEQSFDRNKLILFFKVDSSHGEIKLNEENTEYGWFTKFPSHSVFDYLTYLAAKHV
jgi:8-oxo-dGTP diphosphatase